MNSEIQMLRDENAELRKKVADLERNEFAAIERERLRIKDGVMALAMAAQQPGDPAEVDRACKALGFRISTLIDGHEDLVLTEAAKGWLSAISETEDESGEASLALRPRP